MASPHDDQISARILFALRDYARSISSATGQRVEDDATLSALYGGLDPRQWISLELFEQVATEYERRFGTDFLVSAVAWTFTRRSPALLIGLPTLATPKTLYGHLDVARQLFARHVHFEVYPIERGAIRFQLRYDANVPKTNRTCRVATGVLHGVPLLFDLPPAVVTESHCWGTGAPCCSYDVRFRTEAPLAAMGLLLGGVAGAIGYMASASLWWLAATGAAYLLGRELQNVRRRQLLTRVSEEHRRLLADNDREFERRYREMQAFNASLEERVEQRTADLQRAMRELRERNGALRAAMEDMKALHGELLEAGVERVLDQQALRELEHEINNPVAFVLANLDHLAEAEPERGDLGELAAAVEDVRLGVDRIRSVVAWFVELHRNGQGQIARYDLAGDLRATLKHLERRWGPGVRVETHLEDVAVPGRGRQLTQVFVNLLRNAAEAMGPKGELRVTARRVGDRVLVRFENDGPGIPPDVLPRIFERGFSTKGTENMGLGLHISKQIVERHGGRLGVASSDGRGACFEVELPAWTEPPSSTGRPPPSGRARLPSRPD